jgi:signal peptidase
MKKSEIVLIIILLISVLIILSSRIGSAHFLVVLSGSMSPTINMGDLVIVSPTNPENIKVNDIIAFRNEDKRVPTTHRVIEITERGFKTKGDANEDPDSRIVKPNEVIGKVVFKIPYTGYLVHYARSKYGFIFLVLVPGIAIIIGEVRNILKYTKESKKTKRIKKSAAYILLLLIFFSTHSVTSGYFSDTEVSVGNTFTAWVTVPAEISINPVDDAFVKSKTPDTNYGDKKIIMITNINDKIINEGFLKFDLSGLPDDAYITSAKLYLYGLGISFGKNIGIPHSEGFNPSSKFLSPARVDILFVKNDSWDEDEITWSNKPSAEDILDIQPIGFPGWYSWDVTSKVKEEFENDKIISLMLSTDKGLAILLSKELEKGKPYLFIEYSSANPVNEGEAEETPDPSLDEFLEQEARNVLTNLAGGGSAGPTQDNPSSDPKNNRPTNNTTQNCTENWNCTEWFECINGTQNRTCIDLNNCNTTFNKPIEIRECNTTQNCTEDWSCTEWSECINGTQTRNCTDLNDCNTTLNKPLEFRECNSTEGNFTCEDLCGDGICQEVVCLGEGCPCQENRESCPIDCAMNSTDNTTQNCTENWNCTEWSECINGIQTRVCIDLSNCNTTFLKPNETQECNTTECVENWNCTEWSECLDGTQTRTCIDLNECNTTLDKPPELQECDVTNTTTTTSTTTTIETTTTLEETTTTTTIPTNETS